MLPNKLNMMNCIRLSYLTFLQTFLTFIMLLFKNFILQTFCIFITCPIFTLISSEFWFVSGIIIILLLKNFFLFEYYFITNHINTFYIALFFEKFIQLIICNVLFYLFINIFMYLNFI